TPAAERVPRPRQSATPHPPGWAEAVAEPTSPTSRCRTLACRVTRRSSDRATFCLSPIAFGSFDLGSLLLLSSGLSTRCGQLGLHASFKLLDSLPELLVLAFQLARLGLLAPGEEGIGGPPVDAHLTRRVDGGDQKSHLQREKLDVQDVDHDVAG